MRIVYEGRGGYIEIDDARYPIEHVEGGRFCILFPAGNRGPARDAHLAELEALVAREPERWAIEDRRRRR